MSPIFFDGSSASITVNVGSSMVTLALVSQTANSINVTATISYSDAVRLNGTWIDCAGTRLNIDVDLLSKYHFHKIFTLIKNRQVFGSTNNLMEN